MKKPQAIPLTRKALSILLAASVILTLPNAMSAEKPYRRETGYEHKPNI